MEVIKVQTKEQLEDAFAIRIDVFVHEQLVPMEEEIDEFEDEATHFVCYENNKVVGAGRLRIIDDYGKIERICIEKSARSKGVGSLLMKKIEETALENDIKKTKLNAQTQATPFYSKLGYHIISEEFLDAGIPHVTMQKNYE